MEPKEKAKYLVAEMYDANSGNGNSIKSALICVYEILNQYNKGKFDYKILDEQESEYWKEVDLEIRKL